MLKELGAAALKDMMGMLIQEKTFFSADHDVRKSVLQKYLPAYPESLTSYMNSVSGDQFMKDMAAALEFFNDPKVVQSGFLDALMAYISRDLGLTLDALTADFFFAPYSERLQHLKTLFSDETMLGKLSVEFFSESTYQEITEVSNEAIGLVQDIPTIVIQSPLELESELRKTVRLYFLEKYPYSFPSFQVNPQLIGGMRVLVQGKVVDHSWLHRIQALTALR